MIVKLSSCDTYAVKAVMRLKLSTIVGARDTLHASKHSPYAST
jgi:hypothetical protein